MPPCSPTRDRFRGRRVGLILAGGNIDPRLAASIMVRELAREQQVDRRARHHPRPARRARRDRAHHRRGGGNILDVFHRRTMLSVPPKGASVDVTVETHGPDHAAEIIAALTAHGFGVER